MALVGFLFACFDCQGDQRVLLTYLSSFCPGGHLRPFRKALHLSRSFADEVVALHDCHPIQRVLGLQNNKFIIF